MSSYTVDVSGIAPSTTETQLHDFFTFCGKITSINHAEKSGKATIGFEKSGSAKTALMLNGGTLDGASLEVTSDVAHKDEDTLHDTATPVDQADKPRAGIAAEYLAKGYVLSDHILERAIALDKEKGISTKFLNYFHLLDKRVGERTLGPDRTLSAQLQSTVDNATQQARSFDEQKGYSKTAHDYYLKAIASPLGQRVREFYTSTSKQVRDIHEEARRIAEQDKGKGGASPPQSAPAAATVHT